MLKTKKFKSIFEAHDLHMAQSVQKSSHEFPVPPL